MPGERSRTTLHNNVLEFSFNPLSTACRRVAEKSYEKAMQRSITLIRTLQEWHKEELEKLMRTSFDKGVELGRRLAREEAETHWFVSVAESSQTY